MLESWFVDAHATALWPPAKVLEWLTDELPAEWERTFPDPETFGQSKSARRSAARAEELYPASG